MSLCVELVGRIAKLKNWSGSVGENGAYVQILSWDERSSEFSAKLLETHVIVATELSQLELHTADEFSARFPNAPVVSGISLGRSWPTEVVADFRTCEEVIVNPSSNLHVTISGSARAIGPPTVHDRPENICICLAQNFHVETANDDDIVEFENLNFDQSEFGVGQKIVCSRGNVVFRNCIFSKSSFGLIVGSDLAYTPIVTLEGCSFLQQRECALTVNCGRVTLVSCIFEDVGVGICVKEGAFLVVKYSQFRSCVSGIVCPTNSTALLLWCRFDRMETYCVHVGNGSTVHTDQCSFVDSMQGIVVSSTGKAVSTAVIVGGCALRCKVGLQVGNGRAKVRANKPYFDKCAVGICIGIDAKGTIALAGCHAFECTTGLLDVSSHRCVTSLDGTALTQSLQRTRVMEACSNLAISYAMLGVAPTLNTMRVFKDAGVQGSKCDGCSVYDSELECLKMCAGCRKARYCSRACQKTHFHSVHKQQCKELQVRTRCMQTQGYIACAQCHSVEVQRPQAEHLPWLFCGDLGDLELFYCNTTCRAEHTNARRGWWSWLG